MARELWCLNGGPLNGDQLPAEDSDADGLVARVEQKSTGVHLGDYVLQRGAWRWHPAPPTPAQTPNKFLDGLLAAMLRDLDEQQRTVFYYGNPRPRDPFYDMWMGTI
jgi:hypothetical protein